MFDKKVIKKSIIIIVIILLILISITFIRRAFSRYESDAKSNADVNLAFWLVNETFVSEEFAIGEIKPMPEDPVDPDLYIKTVDFTVQNYKDNLSTDVPIKYDINLRTTTNIPLKYELYKYKDGILNLCNTSEEFVFDDDGTCYKEINATASLTNGNEFFLGSVYGEVGKEQHRFLLKVYLPSHISDDYPEEENHIFADLVDYVKLEINAKQLVSEEEKE